MEAYGQLRSLFKKSATSLLSFNANAYYALLLKLVQPITNRFPAQSSYQGSQFTKNKIIIITGTPRSGSTLLNQVLINSFNFNYYSNYNMLFRGRWFRSTRNKPLVYKSYFGHTFGLYGPNEANELFDNIKFNGSNELSNTLPNICTTNSPNYIFKNIRNYKSILDLPQNNPDIYIIWCTRDVVLNIQSTFNAYKKLASFHPIPLELNHEDMHNDPLEFATKQVYYILKYIHTIGSQIPSKQFTSVSYEELCDNSFVVLDKLSQKFEIAYKIDNIDLKKSSEIKLSNYQLNRIDNVLSNLSRRHNFDARNVCSL